MRNVNPDAKPQISGPARNFFAIIHRDQKKREAI
jgi:hypothetical protein